MNLLKRIVYLLDRMKLLPTTISIRIPVQHSFYILIRMARHSLTCANQVLNIEKLFKILFFFFLIDFRRETIDGFYYSRISTRNYHTEW
jgi:hypothetical protein